MDYFSVSFNNWMGLRKYMAVVILLFLFSCEQKSMQEKPLLVDMSSDIIIPKHYTVTKCFDPILIDGVADETAWDFAEFTDSFIDIKGEMIPALETKIKMLWDKNFLYIYARMQEPHIWGTLKKRDTIIFHNNDFEVFIDPSGIGRNYGEIEINAFGTVWDLLLDKPYRVYGKPINHWNLDELRSAVHLQGTLNNSNDVDTLWSVEMAIPMSALTELKNSSQSVPVEGEQWRINFSRVEWDFDIVNGVYKRKSENGSLNEEHNWVWSSQQAVNMHIPERWGILQFTTARSSADVLFKEDQDMLIKQIAYSLYRQTRFGSLKELQQHEVGYTKNINVKYLEGDTLIVLFNKTYFGYEYKIESPHSGKCYIINDEGLLKAL